MITVNFFNQLKTLLKTKQIRIHASEISVFELLTQCETQASTPFIKTLLNEQGHLIPGTMILVNGQNVQHLEEMRTIVRNGADVALFPPNDEK